VDGTRNVPAVPVLYLDRERDIGSSLRSVTESEYSDQPIPPEEIPTGKRNPLLADRLSTGPEVLCPYWLTGPRNARG
jgi:hypothetical protein